MSLKERILAADDIPSERVSVPEWGIDLEVRGMTGAERSKWIREQVAGREDQQVDPAQFYGALLVPLLRDPETHDTIFTESDIVALGQKSGAVLERLATVATRLSGLFQAAVEEKKENSGATQNSAPGPGSPSSSGAD